MKIYQSSYLELFISNPTLGSDRHDGEDSHAINQPVVYFTTAEDETMRGKSKEQVAAYKYIFEIPKDDSGLFLVEKDYGFRQECNQAFGESDSTRWYFLKSPFAIEKTLEWGGNKYVKRENL